MKPGRKLPLLLLLLLPGLVKAQERYYHLLAGTYTSGISEGIYVYRFDSQTGKIVHTYTAKGVENPSFLAASADGDFVYSVNELGGGKEGEISAFSFDNSTGKLELINKQVSGGGSPCYISLSPDGKFLVAANYSGGNLSVFPLSGNGSLETPVQIIRHEGSSVNKQRQEKPHVHSVVFSPNGKFLFTGDLGTDKVNAYRYHPERTSRPLTPASPPFTKVTAGGGPRHLVFNDDATFAYLVLEMTGMVSVFRHENGRLKEIQQIPMTAPGFSGESGAAEIRISPDGKFLYASNRGDANEITIYAIDAGSGKLTIAGRQPTLGKTPRNFMISPDGNFLLAANQNSNSIVVFHRDPESGLLKASKERVTIGNPVYLMMLPVADNL
ncbi:6-phosphogluconolactonase [Anseongella ginsenosidimutans]|uniref:6-phosphogluconolactonase n=1 Tax=Anseongella ginsenosidimutans TaxID=496056 RepID=A0A4R3KRV1_9SPHI|nr:lactonase family protein [Anseongella ginsenosidimutans]QEC53142.1 lactonase family protein [Anseongella ginsenosidimutans]TCS87764.1 6-phosphogluconolactonase [Anseongella ginsenosidimutans]